MKDEQYLEHDENLRLLAEIFTNPWDNAFARAEMFRHYTACGITTEEFMFAVQLYYAGDADGVGLARRMGCSHEHLIELYEGLVERGLLAVYEENGEEMCDVRRLFGVILTRSIKEYEAKLYEEV